MFKIFVGNLGPTATADAIKMLFNRHVDVDDVALPTDEATGKLRGFAIVMIKDEVKARAALAAMRGARLNGRPLVINVARKKGEAPPKRENRRGFRSRPGAGGGSGGAERTGGPGGGTGGSGGGYGRPRAYGNRPSNSSRFGNRGPDRGGSGPRDQGRSPGGPSPSR